MKSICTNYTQENTKVSIEGALIVKQETQSILFSIPREQKSSY